MRKSLLACLAAVALAGSGQAQDAPKLEQQVLAVLNAARADPAGFAQSLRQFRTLFQGKDYALPGSAEIVETIEGTRAVDDAVASLTGRAGLLPMAPASLLAAAAADHVIEQAADGSTGHAGRDGSTPSERVMRRGGGRFVAEVIEYGAVDALDVVRQLIVDDGVPDRGHRNILFDPRLRFAGVSCGTHPTFGTMCVIDLGVNADGRDLPNLRMAEAKSASIRPAL